MAKHFHVLWAVDPAPQHKRLQIKTAEALSVLLRGLDADVEPVTVVSPDQIRVPADLFEPHSAEHRAEVERTIASWAGETGLTGIRPPKTLVQEEFSLHRSAGCLLAYARETGANLIALGSNARTGVARAVLGSFAESVALQSETPLFVVNGETRPLNAITRILFPTDFSAACRAALEALLPVAAAKGARLTFFHKLDYVVPETQDLFARFPRYHEYLEQDLAEKRKKAEEWGAIASRQGVP
ncbi:MAG TPA: universal stress protein, partial [Terriglobia bacterium]|nr:universal stress protein [Terriglobia bacterium]